MSNHPGFTDQQFVSHLMHKVGLHGFALDAETASRKRLEAFVELARVKAKGNKNILEFIAWGWE